MLFCLFNRRRSAKSTKSAYVLSKKTANKIDIQGFNKQYDTNPPIINKAIYNRVSGLNWSERAHAIHLD
jgi:hypothetical protein